MKTGQNIIQSDFLPAGFFDIRISTDLKWQVGENEPDELDEFSPNRHLIYIITGWAPF